MTVRCFFIFAYQWFLMHKFPLFLFAFLKIVLKRVIRLSTDPPKNVVFWYDTRLFFYPPFLKFWSFPQQKPIIYHRKISYLLLLCALFIIVNNFSLRTQLLNTWTLKNFRFVEMHPWNNTWSRKLTKRRSIIDLKMTRLVCYLIGKWETRRSPELLALQHNKINYYCLCSYQRAFTHQLQLCRIS